MKWCCKRCDKGLTLVELMVSLAILLIVLALGYNFYFYLNSSYKSTENKWVKQREVRKAADFINADLKNTYSLSVSSTAPTSGVADEYDIYLNAGQIMFRDGTNTPVVLASGGLTLQFQKAKSKDNLDMDNVLSYIIASPEINYSVDSAVYLSNMPKSKSIVITSIGSAIHFATATDIASIPSPELGSFCFIATAAYGTNTQPSVVLLREFRDEMLLKSVAGRDFVDFYYSVSPAVAKVITGSMPLRYLVLILLMPIVGIVVLLMYKEALLLLLLFIAGKLYYDRSRNSIPLHFLSNGSNQKKSS